QQLQLPLQFPTSMEHQQMDLHWEVLLLHFLLLHFHLLLPILPNRLFSILLRQLLQNKWNRPRIAQNPHMSNRLFPFLHHFLHPSTHRHPFSLLFID
ncbi:hypothetical protein PFISCL1PPCAC_15306, partial [Pristionchus fissidentatus]